MARLRFDYVLSHKRELYVLIIGLAAVFGLAIVYQLFIAPPAFNPSEEAKEWVKKEKKSRQLTKNQSTKLDRALDMLNSSDHMMFEQNRWVFERLGERGVPGLMEVCNSPASSRRERINAIYILGTLGKDSSGAVPSLISILRENERDDDLKAITLLALGKIGPSARSSLPIVTRLSQDDHRWVRESAQFALKRINGDTSAPTPDIFSQLK